MGPKITAKTTSTQSTTTQSRKTQSKPTVPTKTTTTASTVKTKGRNSLHFNKGTVQYRRAKYSTCCRTVPAIYFLKISGVNHASLYQDLITQSHA